MKSARPGADVERYRVYDGPLGTDATSGWTGAFQFPFANVICSTGEGWDHVSVSRRDRCPTWEEMCRVKAMFFGPEETVVQYHPKQSEYVNCHPFCLHLWRWQEGEFPRPPRMLVG